MLDELDKYQNKGHFFFSTRDKIEDVTKDIPSFVEAFFLQEFFDIYGRLPEWNETF